MNDKTVPWLLITSNFCVDGLRKQVVIVDVPEEHAHDGAWYFMNRVNSTAAVEYSAPLNDFNRIEHYNGSEPIYVPNTLRPIDKLLEME